MENLITTERLLIREFKLDDAPFVFDLLNSPTWIQYIGDRQIHDLEAAKNYLRNGPIASYQKHGFGLFMVLLEKERAPIGTCGLLQRTCLDFPDIGFALMPKYEGQGLAYEAASAIVEYAEKKLQLPELYGVTSKDNVRSQKLLIKIGLTFSHNIDWQGEQAMLFLKRNSL